MAQTVYFLSAIFGGKLKATLNFYDFFSCHSCRIVRGEAHVECHSRWRHEVGSVISMLWVKSQSLRQENLRLKNQIQALSKEAEQMKLLLQQSSMQFAGEPPTDTNATPSREGVRRLGLSFLFSNKRDELIWFKTNAMAELERLGKKVEAVIMKK